MNTRQITTLAAILTTGLATGCAHGKAENRAARDADERTQTATAGADHDRSDGAKDANGERVDIPKPGRERDRMASAGGDLPSDNSANPRPASAEQLGSDADNTRVNERDREANALTPMDQSEAAGDRELLARIRKAVIADDSLSFTAKNVKIITRDGRVTLRGSVNNERERTTIERAAQEAAGPDRVVNQLEVSE
jgi:osmotically-inducible protein OsmY